VWQHYAGVAKLEKQVADLRAEKQQLADELEISIQTASNLQTSIQQQADAMQSIELNQRRIRRDLNEARQGLDSQTITQEAQDDPVQAAIDLSDRWNNLGRMFDDETNAFGRPGPAPAARPAEPD
jgi:regulator of replication initiation timing